MTSLPTSPAPAAQHRGRRLLAVFLLLLLLVTIAVVLYLRSAAFQQAVERYVSDQIYLSTGARPRIGRFHFAFRPLSIDLTDVTLQGREAADQPPLGHIAHLLLGLKLTSWLHHSVDLSHVRAEEPDFHVYQLADGKSNLPSPPTAPRPGAPPAGAPFDLGVRTLDFWQGELQLADRRVPLQMSLHNFRLHFVYEISGRYDGEFSFATSPIQYADFLPAFERAEMRFKLWPNALQLDAVSLHGPAADLEAEAMLASLSAPALNAHYILHLHLPALAVMAREPFATAGEARLEGGAHWQTGGWAADGALHVQNLALRAPAPTLSGLRGDGRFRADPRGLVVPQLHLFGLGGAADIQGEVAQWKLLHMAAQVHGIELNHLWPLILAPRTVRQYQAILRDTRAGMEGMLHLDGPVANLARLGVQLNLQLTPRRVDGNPALIPVAGTIEGTAYPAESRMEVARSALQFSGLSLQTHGHLSPYGMQLAVQANADLAQFSPLLVRLHLFAASVPAQGMINFVGTVAGALPQPVLSGRLQGGPLRIGQFSTDRVDVTASLAPNLLDVQHGVWQLGTQRVTASGQVSLAAYALSNTGPFAADLQVQNLTLATVQNALTQFPAGRQALSRTQAYLNLNQGVLNARLALHGRLEAPTGSGDFDVHGIRVAGQSINEVSAHIQGADRQFQLQHLAVVIGASRLSGQASYAVPQQAFTVDLSTPGIQLQDIALLQSPKLTPSGSVRLQLHGFGTLTDPQGTLHLEGSGMRAGGETLGHLLVTATAAHGVAQLQATDDLPDGRVVGNGTLGLTSPFPLQAQLTLADYDTDALLRRFTGLRITGHSHVYGVLQIRGPLAQPDALVAQANISRLVLAVEGLSLHNSGPIQATLNHRTLDLTSAHIVGEDTDLSAQGQVHLEKGGALAMSLQGRINLLLIHTVSPQTHASGVVVMNGTVSGTLSQPQLDGRLTLQDASVAEEDFPIAFDRINGSLRFSGNQLQIEQLTAETGGGRLSVTGSAAYARDTGVTVDLTAAGTSMRVRYQGVSATADLNLHLAGAGSGARLSGEVELTRIALLSNFDLAFFIANRKSAPSLPTSNSLLNQLRLDVHLVTGPAVQFATNLAHLEMQADLRLRGTAAAPVLLGRVSASQGEVLFAGNRYTVTKAELTFANPFRIEPLVDFGLSTTVQQYDVTLNMSGTADKLNVSYRSDPPLSSTDIISLLATGQTHDRQALVNQQASSTFVGQSEQLLGQALENVAASRLQRLFGVTQIQVNPNLNGPTGSSGSVTIQQQVSHDVKLTYTQDLSRSSQDVVQVEWTINRRLGLTLTRDQFNIYSMDLHFRHRVR
ncbi:MAG: translocation/assembly module TamB domain-containing protein [Terriglobales bacterium]